MDPQAALSLVQLLRVYYVQRSKKRRYGIHPINQRRVEAGQYHSLLGELKADAERFRQYTRMSRDAFAKLLDFVQKRLQKRSRREAIGPEERLIICLRFLSSGADFHSLSTTFRIGVSTACKICHEVSAVLAEVLAPLYLTTPSTPAEWQEIADGFSGKWNMPNALGAIDGKHIRIRQPHNSHSLYYNYKQFFSTVLIVVADYRISRARRVVESTFGIMAAKWRLLLKPIETSLQNADTIVKAICCLHNFLIAEGEAGQTVSAEDLETAEQLTQAVMRNPRATHPALDGQLVRNMLVEFFNGVGALEWQDEMI